MMNSIHPGRGQQALIAQVQETEFCTACGACVNLCPYQAFYRDEVVTVHTCDLKEGKGQEALSRGHNWQC